MNRADKNNCKIHHRFALSVVKSGKQYLVHTATEKNDTKAHLVQTKKIPFKVGPKKHDVKEHGFEYSAGAGGNDYILNGEKAYDYTFTWIARISGDCRGQWKISSLFPFPSL